ncbi:hypothetical protein BC940DRAFT_290235 [Gongronella butleri]|nr:hypothetical protein BC940DRAFT_290235 [Gongronella butleri]
MGWRGADRLFICAVPGGPSRTSPAFEIVKKGIMQILFAPFVPFSLFPSSPFFFCCSTRMATTTQDDLVDLSDGFVLISIIAFAVYYLFFKDHQPAASSFIAHPSKSKAIHPDHIQLTPSPSNSSSPRDLATPLLSPLIQPTKTANDAQAVPPIEDDHEEDDHVVSNLHETPVPSLLSDDDEIHGDDADKDANDHQEPLLDNGAVAGKDENTSVSAIVATTTSMAAMATVTKAVLDDKVMQSGRALCDDACDTPNKDHNDAAAPIASPAAPAPAAVHEQTAPVEKMMQISSIDAMIAKRDAPLPPIVAPSEPATTTDLLESTDDAQEMAHPVDIDNSSPDCAIIASNDAAMPENLDEGVSRDELEASKVPMEPLTVPEVSEAPEPALSDDTAESPKASVVQDASDVPKENPMEPLDALEVAETPLDENVAETPKELLENNVTKAINQELDDEPAKENVDVLDQPRSASNGVVTTSWADDQDNGTTFSADSVQQEPTCKQSRPARVPGASFVPARYPVPAEAIALYQQPAPTGKPRADMSRLEKIEQQQQTYAPRYKSRCEFWPGCTNKKCKYHHPVMNCRNGDQCAFGKKCAFLHPSDYVDFRQQKQKRKQRKQKQQLEQAKQQNAQGEPNEQTTGS